MITNFLIGTIVLIFSSLVSIIPNVSFTDIPVVGPFVIEYLSLAMSYWNGFMNLVPYLHLPWTILLTVIIPFEMGLLIAKFFFGSRLPVHN